MNKIIAVLVLLVASIPGFAASYDGTCYPNGIVIGTLSDASSAPTMPGNGDLLLTGNIMNPNGIMARMDHWQDLPAKSSAAICGIVIDSGTLMGGGTTFTSAMQEVTQPSAPRNVCVSLDAVSGDTGMTGYKGSVTITGYDARNNSQYEVIVSTYRTLTYGKKAFSKVTSIAWTSSSIKAGAELTMRCNVGTGDAIGLMGSLLAGTSAYKVVETYVDKALSTYTFDSVNQTWTPTNVPNATIDYDIYYLLYTK